MTAMESIQFHQLRKALGAFYWENDFQAFCRVTGFDPQFPYAQEKWQQFSACVQAMAQLDDRTWERLLEASFNAQRSVEPLVPR
jgi:arabinogalactan endo-1,4-beta-galactosidase